MKQQNKKKLSDKRRIQEISDLLKYNQPHVSDVDLITQSILDIEITKSTKTVDISINSKNEVKASSIKIYNLLKFSQLKFQQSILTIIGASGGIISGSLVPTILGMIGLIAVFMGNSKKEYNDQDAKVLLSIYYLGKLCHISTIKPKYDNLFKDDISKHSIEKSLRILEKFKTIQIRGEEVEITETINITSE